MLTNHTYKGLNDGIMTLLNAASRVNEEISSCVTADNDAQVLSEWAMNVMVQNVDEVI